MKIITIAVVGIISLILLYRVLYISGCKLPASKGRFRPVTGSLPEYTGYSYTVKDILVVAGESLFFRLLMYLISFLLLRLIFMQDGTFLDWWLKWDATNYVSIAQDGYKGIVIENIYELGDAYQTLVFFPLYPFFVRLINYIFQNIYVSALVTSSLCYVGGCIFIYMAVAMRYGKSIATKAVVLLSVFPFSFFFGAMMPESTFLLVGGACIFFTNKKKWWLAGIFGFLGALSRMQGILLLAYVGIEWLEEYQIFLLLRMKEFKEFFKKLVYLIPMLFIPLGSFVYLLINYLNTGDWFYFMKLQKYVWAHSFAGIGRAMEIIGKLATTPSEGELIMTVYIPHIVLFFFVMLVILMLFRRHKDSLAVFLLIYTVISFSTDFLVSGGRYLSIAIPLFIMLAEFGERRPMLYRMMVATGLSLQVIFMACHLVGWHMVT